MVPSWLFYACEVLFLGEFGWEVKVAYLIFLPPAIRICSYFWLVLASGCLSVSQHSEVILLLIAELDLGCIAESM